MKNLFVLPTDKPSRLYYIFGKYSNMSSRVNEYRFRREAMPDDELECKNQHIHITSNEKIKEGDWCLDKFNQRWKLEDERLIAFDSKGIKRFSTDNILGHDCKKIILTTDQDLIKDGVQAIDDEFLEWFVKNPSCEEIGVLTNNMKNADYIEVAERLYKYINPTSKMDCPNSVYITTEKWYYEWLNIETDLELFDWCVKFKNK